jgi:hypothetical protein
LHDKPIDNDENSLARYEFLEFLVLFSNDKLGREVDMRSGQINGPANALFKVINEFLIPLHTKLNSGPVRAALKEESVHQFLLPRLPQLMKVYQYYASLDGEDTPPPPSGKKLAAKKKASLMDLDEFILLLEHSGLLDDVTIMKTNAKESSATQLKNAKATLTAQEVRETFSANDASNKFNCFAGGKLNLIPKEPLNISNIDMKDYALFALMKLSCLM